ncbi:MAG: hypothetical protein ACREV9_01605 [Burkholderiales bacterium]
MSEIARERVAKSLVGIALLIVPGALPVAAAIILYRRLAHGRAEPRDFVSPLLRKEVS